ncbi:MAG: putative lipid II flippase FtsW [Actinomycetota bacterium]
MTSTIRRSPSSSSRRRASSGTRSSTARTSTAGKTAGRSSAARGAATTKTSARKPAAKRPAAKRPAAKKAAARTGATRSTAARSTARTSTAKRSTATRSTAKRSTARTSTARKATAKKATARSAAGRTSTARSTAKKTTARKTAAKRSTGTGTTARKSTTRSSTSTRSTQRRSGTTRSTSSRSAATRSTSARATATRGAGRTRSRTTARSSTARRTPRSSGGRDIEIEEAPLAFRARRRDDEAKGGRRRKRSSGSGGRRRRRKSKVAVTDAGERNAAFLTATVLGLTLFGLVMVLSASSVSSLHQYADSPFFQFKRQVMWAAIGGLAFIVASRIDYRLLRPLATPLLLIVIGLLVALFVPGVGINTNGSTRWLGLGPVVVQPSELAKLVFVIFIADLLARRERRMDQPELTIRPVMLVLVLLSALMILQPKLGTPIILGAVSILVLFVAGARMRNLIGWLGAAMLAASLAAYLAPYRKNRLLSFLDPWDDPQGIGLQAIQSQVGISSGGWYGLGLGASRAKWGFLPFAHTDFIFAIVAEEVGLIGASALIGGFLLIAWFGFRAAVHAPDRFGSLLAAGITSWLLVQAFLNIGMVLGVMPITGEALPFVSAGGSSLVTMLAAAGLLVNVSRRSKE